MITSQRLRSLFVLALLCPAVQVVTAGDEFRLVLLPDTQLYSESHPEIYAAQTQWIKDRAEPDNIKFVIHLGDIVQNPDAEEEWKNADRAHRVLDGVVPYSMLPGNHDMRHEDGQPVHDTPLYDKYFPVTRFDKYPWYGGHQGRTNGNNYCFFEAGEMKFMVLSLEFAPTDAALRWAGRIVNEHPGHRVIVATHCYMRLEGRDCKCGGQIGNGGQGIWNKLIRKHKNIFLVVSGHVLGITHQTSMNDAGEPVHEILCDYQGYPNGGNGWLQTLRFVPEKNQIHVEAYSPHLKRHNKDPQHTYAIPYATPAVSVSRTSGGAEPDGNPIYAFARQRVEETRRQQTTKMPAWLKENRDAYRDRLAASAQKSYEQTGIWFLARAATREKDEQETDAVWGELLTFGDLTTLPSYSEENHQQAITFWQSWQNRKTGRLYNPLHQDPQNPEVKRDTPGNHKDYSADAINTKYIPVILGKLGAKLPGPVNTLTHAQVGVDTFDQLWKWIPQWFTSPAGAFPVEAARQVDGGNLDKIPQVEAGMAALVRAYNRETGMWRPEPLEGFPWKDYQPSSGFKIVSRICGYVGMENFPEDVLKTSIDNLLAHKGELYAHVSTARNYGETMAHYMMLTDYRHDELLDAMELCLERFRDPKMWEDTGTGAYCVFGYGFIGAFMNWEDLPFDQAMPQWFRFEHGCMMKWRFVVGPYGNWVNVIPKKPEAILGHANYDVNKVGLKARNQTHWAKQITEVIPPEDVALTLAAAGTTGEGTLPFTLTQDQLANLKAPYLKATWSGGYDISLNGKSVKQVRYNLPDVPAGWHVPASAAKTLRAGENAITVKLIGPGKETKPGAPFATRKPFLRLGVCDWQ